MALDNRGRKTGEALRQSLSSVMLHARCKCIIESVFMSYCLHHQWYNINYWNSERLLQDTLCIRNVIKALFELFLEDWWMWLPLVVPEHPQEQVMPPFEAAFCWLLVESIHLHTDRRSRGPTIK